MADQQQSSVAAPFPAPPGFYKHFTQDNLAQLRKIRKEQANNGATTEAAPTNNLDILSLPPELRYLIPPPQPSPSSTYRTFASHINPTAPEASLADAGIEQLYTVTPSLLENPQPQMLALARSLLTTFLGLIGTLAANPTLYEESVNDIQTIMFNLHDLVNRYRPHQARESLVLVMEERVERIRAEIGKVREGREKVKELVDGLGNGGRVEGDVEQQEKADDDVRAKGVEREAQRGLWSEMDKVMA